VLTADDFQARLRAMSNGFRRLSWRVRIAGAALVLLGLGGCGANRTYPVEGKVLFKDGTPVTGGLVVFESVDQPTVCARGPIRADGSFRLGTFKTNDGAVPGRHRVLVTPPMPNSQREAMEPPIHPRFATYETSELEFTVEPGKNTFTIEVDRP
jgi:hypothetical protein